MKLHSMKSFYVFECIFARSPAISETASKAVRWLRRAIRNGQDLHLKMYERVLRGGTSPESHAAAYGMHVVMLCKQLNRI